MTKSGPSCCYFGGVLNLRRTLCVAKERLRPASFVSYRIDCGELKETANDHIFTARLSGKEHGPHAVSDRSLAQ